ncbi:hypothetical protein CSUI_004695 [Cystoisospora suis]|uniref:Uncharacterized protein n=1 Tax=Cystoisospora suis TaxID=483139 RepID=A0A2C6L046_9APIC|nr:hypothetical protein CSUI_004695 [Cystoisospora suis]
MVRSSRECILRCRLTQAPGPFRQGMRTENGRAVGLERSCLRMRRVTVHWAIVKSVESARTNRGVDATVLTENQVNSVCPLFEFPPVHVEKVLPCVLCPEQFGV